MKKLTLTPQKCGKIHIGKKSMECPILNVHKEKIRDSDSEKYLGYIISNKGTLDNTMKDQKLKGYSYIAEIRVLLSDMPFVRRRIEVGLMLRYAMFVNGILTNSEAWHSITEQHIQDLEVMDRMLLKYILGAHSTIHTEFLYSETGATPLKQVITCRRIVYLHTILKRPATELTHKVYKAQQENPVKGDWVQLLEKDLEMLGMVLNEDKVKELSKAQYKTEIKSRVKSVVIELLQKKQEEHTKIKHIKYEKLSMQKYLKSHMFNSHEASTLISLRSRQNFVF